MAKYAKAWDSIKSPLKLKSSINFSEPVNFFLMLSIIYLFFLPPPESSTKFGFFFKII